ncbi:MAG: 4Fe-4S dicluster domain-containing protein [Polyangia bacterium]|jgi:heterodisulfide reductase subunit C
MTVTLSGPEIAGDFAAAVEQESHANLMACLQCKKCTSGCPVAALADLKPHEMVRKVQFGQRDVLSSKMLWQCTSCLTCATRCPQKVSVAALNDGLRRMSVAAQTPSKSAAPTFNRIFMKAVRKRGRMHEALLMAAFKLRTLRLFDDMGKLPMMLGKGKLPLWSAAAPGRRERERLFARAAQMKETKP